MIKTAQLQTLTRTTTIEILLEGEQFSLLPQLQELFPDLALKWLFDAKSIYHATLHPDVREINQIRFLLKHAIKHIQPERERENVIKAFFVGVELEANPLTFVEVQRVATIPNYHSVTLATHEDNITLRFPPQWSFGQKQIV